MTRPGFTDLAAVQSLSRHQVCVLLVFTGSDHQQPNKLDAALGIMLTHSYLQSKR